MLFASREVRMEKTVAEVYEWDLRPATTGSIQDQRLTFCQYGPIKPGK